MMKELHRAPKIAFKALGRYLIHVWALGCRRGFEILT